MSPGRFPQKHLRDLVTRQTPFDGHQLSVVEFEHVINSQFEYVQFRKHEGYVDGLIRVHRTTLVSSDAAVVLDQWPIKGNTTEMGTICLTLQWLFDAYGSTKMVELITVDAPG